MSCVEQKAKHAKQSEKPIQIARRLKIFFALSPNRWVIRVKEESQDNNYEMNREGKLCRHARLAELICKSLLLDWVPGRWVEVKGSFPGVHRTIKPRLPLSNVP